MESIVQVYRDTWKTEQPNIPYGYCWCGCGGRTNVARQTRSSKGHVRGEPVKWAYGHRERCGQLLSPEAYRAAWRSEQPEIPYGKCWCGCGQSTPIAPQSHAFKGYVKGEPKKWLIGHANRRPRSIVAQDRGFDTECWIWQGAASGNSDGGHLYGTLRVGRVIKKAHRVIYEQERGAIPEGFELHHLCEQTLCVNPDHLVPLSKAEHFKTYVQHFSSAGLRARWGSHF